VASRIRIPSLTLAAGQDCFVHEEQIRIWHKRIPGSNKALNIYPNAFHLLWHDSDREQVLGDIHEWITAKVAQPAGDKIDASCKDGKSRS